MTIAMKQVESLMSEIEFFKTLRVGKTVLPDKLQTVNIFGQFSYKKIILQKAVCSERTKLFDITNRSDNSILFVYWDTCY